MKAALGQFAEIGFEFDQRGAVEGVGIHAILPQFLDVAVGRLLALARAPDLDPARGPQKIGGPGGLRDLEMFGRRGEHERLHRPRGLDHPVRSREAEILPERLGVGRQRAVADVGARIAIERGVGDLGRVARKRIGDDRFALDEAGVAKARLVRRLAVAVDQRDFSSARLQRQRRRHPDHPGPEDDCIIGTRRHPEHLFRRSRLDSRRSFL